MERSKDVSIPHLVSSVKEMKLNKNVYKSKLAHLHDVRYHYTYDGVMMQIERFLLDPFGPNGGQLRCIPHPNTERVGDELAPA